MLQKIVINKIISLLAKQFKLYKIMKYVEEPNDADNRISELEIRLFQLGRKFEELEKLSHPPRKFIRCEQCKQEIKTKEK